MLDLFSEKEITLSIIESITGGELSSKITKNPGASSVLKGSSVVYTNDSKNLLLDGEYNLKNWPELTEILSDKGLDYYSSDICLSILGEAGPISSSNYGIGEIFISIANNSQNISTKHKLNGNREEIIQRAVNKALWELIKFVKNLN